MKIIWSDFASQMLKEIFVYHKENVSHLVAKSIRNSIFQTTAKLKDYPQLGQIELNLSQLMDISEMQTPISVILTTPCRLRFKEHDRLTILPFFS